MRGKKPRAGKPDRGPQHNETIAADFNEAMKACDPPKGRVAFMAFVFCGPSGWGRAGGLWFALFAFDPEGRSDP